jgi:uncharacterized protein VirK/YbjX
MKFIAHLIRVYALGREMHPGLTISSIKHQGILMVRALVFYPAIKRWYEISDNPLLAGALRRFPLMSGAMYWPYINHAWAMKRKLATIDQHFRMLGGPAAVVAHAIFEEVELARLDEEYAGLRLVMDKTKWFLREGEVVLNLFVNDQRFYSIAFTLGVDDGLPLIYVGALQGSNSDTAQEVYRNITHALHGMRPRDLMMVALKQLCGEFNINRIWAVSNENRQHNSPYFGARHHVTTEYNKIWLEQGGKALDNGFFEIPATVRYKDVSEIPSRKRATYRRRYQMLDKLALDIRNSCALHASQSLTKVTLHNEERR